MTFRAEGQVVLQDGFSVGAGGRFTAGGGVDLGFPVMTARTYAYQDYQYYLTDGNGPWGMLSWTYDGIGNRLTETRNGMVDTYDYLLNNAGGHSATLDEIQLGMMGLKAYDFGLAGHLEEVDAAGNVIDFSSDAEGRLAQLSRTSVSASFLYDGRSFLTSSVETGTGNFTEPTYSSEGVLCSLFGSADGGATTSRRHVLYFAGRPMASLEVPSTGSESYTFLSADHLGTPFAATDLGGGEVWAGGFEPFGADWQAGTPAGAQENGVFLRFPGQWFDESWEMAGLGAEGYYNVHRWYGAGIGRFSRPDPIGLSADINLYLYGRADPLGYLDLDGRLTVPGPGPEQILRIVGCSQQVRDMTRELRRHANFSYRWGHCFASCKIREECGGDIPGANDAVAFAAGLGKEVVDLYHCVAGDYFRLGDGSSNYCESAFQPEDFKDNLLGLGPAGSLFSCEEQPCRAKCESLENSTTEGVGPLFGRGPINPFLFAF